MSEIYTGGNKPICIFGNDLTIDPHQFVTVSVEPEQANIDVDFKALEAFFEQRALDRAATNDTREDIEKWLRKAS